MGTKRTYKDSLFRSIFKDKKRLSRLYKALSGNEISPKDITINTLKGVFMNDVKNDISFLVGNRLVILLEHQSTWNPNMPLRFLWYLSKLYRLYVNKDMIYHAELLKIPEVRIRVYGRHFKDTPAFIAWLEQRPGAAAPRAADAKRLEPRRFDPLLFRGVSTLKAPVALWRRQGALLSPL